MQGDPFEKIFGQSPRFGKPVFSEKWLLELAPIENVSLNPNSAQSSPALPSRPVRNPVQNSTLNLLPFSCF